MLEVLAKAVAEKTIVEPARLDRPGLRYDLSDPLVNGDVLEIVIIKNGTEIERVKYANEADAPHGEETRAFIHAVMQDMPIFSNKDGVRTVLVTSGELKAVEVDPKEGEVIVKG